MHSSAGLQADRSFAVCASHMDHLKRVLGVSQRASNCSYVVETFLICFPIVFAEVLIVRNSTSIQADDILHERVPSVNVS